MVLRGHTDKGQTPVFSPDDQRIVTVSDNKTARVFRVVTFSFIATYPTDVPEADFWPAKSANSAMNDGFSGFRR